MEKTLKKPSFLQNRWGNLAMAAVLFLAVYGLGSRAIDTGSLGQYGLTFIGLVLAINRLIKAIKG